MEPIVTPWGPSEIFLKLKFSAISSRTKEYFTIIITLRNFIFKGKDTVFLNLKSDIVKKSLFKKTIMGTKGQS